MKENRKKTESPKEYLRKLRILSIKIQQKKDELAELKSEAQSLSGISDNERVQVSSRDRLLEDIAKIVDLERKINGDIARYLVFRNKIIGEIQTLNNPLYIEMLYKRYVEYKTLERVAVEMNYTYAYVRRLHGLALKAFGDKYSDKFK